MHEIAQDCQKKAAPGAAFSGNGYLHNPDL